MKFKKNLTKREERRLKWWKEKQEKDQEREENGEGKSSDDKPGKPSDASEKSTPKTKLTQSPKAKKPHDSKAKARDTSSSTKREKPSRQSKPEVKPKIPTVSAKGFRLSADVQKKLKLSELVQDSDSSSDEEPSTPSTSKSKEKAAETSSTKRKHESEESEAAKKKAKVAALVEQGILPEREIKPRKNRLYILFVGNFPYFATKEDIQTHFAECGGIKDVRIATDKETKKSKGYAFVEFDNKTSHLAAAALHHSEMLGRTINVEFTCPGKGKSKERSLALKRKNKRLSRFRRTANPTGPTTSRKH